MADIDSNSVAPGRLRLAEVIRRVEAQRGAIFQAQAIVQTVVAAMRPGDWSGKPGYPYVLELVDQMLERIAAELEIGVPDMDDAQEAQS